MMLKRFFLTLVALVAATGLFAQARIDNYPLPQHPDTLRILAVGNSFSDDGTEYLPGLLEAAGIHNVIVARLYMEFLKAGPAAERSEKPPPCIHTRTGRFWPSGAGVHTFKFRQSSLTSK